MNLMWNHRIITIVALLAISLLISNSLFSKGRKGPKGRKIRKKHKTVVVEEQKEDRGMADYDEDTFKKIKGKVTKVTTVFNKVKQEKGLHLTLKTSVKEYIVHVCPQWYADKQKITFEKGEKISVSGSTFKKDGEHNIYAATIERDSSDTLKLRNPETGDPLWRGRNKSE